MLAAVVGLLGAMGACAAARADSVSERPDAVAVTVYRDIEGGMAMITETRTVNVEAGVSRIRFRGVAGGIVPQTAAIDGLPTQVLERNQDYDLLSPGSLLERSVGQSVRVVRTDRLTGAVSEQSAVVRSGPDGAVLDFGDHAEALKCSGYPERLIFDKVPAGLSDSATLSVTTRAEKAGRYTVRLSYLATGLDWKASYVATIRPDGKSLDLTAWITLVNDGPTTFADAPTQVVAGRLEHSDDTMAPGTEITAARVRCWRMGTTHGRHGLTAMSANNGLPSAGINEGTVEEVVVTARRRSENMQDVPVAVSAIGQDLGDYKLYTLPQPTTVAAHQSKQVLLLDQRGVKFTRFYGVRVNLDYLEDAEDTEREPHRATSMLRLWNRPGDGLGKAMPQGTFAVEQPGERGPPLVIGFDAIADTPIGLPLEIRMASAFDISVDPVVLRQWDVSGDPDSAVRREVEVTITNMKATPIVFELRQDATPDGFKMIKADRRYGLLYGDPMWKLRLKPGQSVRVRYTVESDY